MPRVHRLRPGAGPARVLKFVRRYPKARPIEISLALGIKLGAVEMAICRLVQMNLYWRPKRAPRQVKPKQSSPSPTESLRAARAQFTAAASIGPSLRLTSAPDVHPTGTPFVVVDGAIRPTSRGCAVQAFAIAGAPAAAAEHSHHGNVVTPGASHPWGYLTNFGKPR